MPNPDLQNYITQSRASGMSDDQIRQNLIGQGWAQETINDSLNKKTFNAIRIVSWSLVGLVLAFITLGLSSLSYDLSPDHSYSGPIIFISVIILGASALMWLNHRNKRRREPAGEPKNILHKNLPITFWALVWILWASFLAYEPYSIFISRNIYHQRIDPDSVGWAIFFWLPFYIVTLIGGISLSGKLRKLHPLVFKVMMLFWTILAVSLFFWGEKLF